MADRFVWLMTYMFISITAVFINRLRKTVKKLKRRRRDIFVENRRQ